MEPRSIIIVLILAILVALGFSIVYLIRDDSSRRRTLTALKVRVGLSLLLIAVFIVSFLMGWLQPNQI